MKTSLATLWQEPRLRPVAPFVLAAWQDGHLTPAELLAIREALERGAWLDEETRAALGGWLDAEHPPPPKSLRELERQVDGWLRALPHAQRRSLSSIGEALAAGSVGAPHADNARDLLASVQDSLSWEELGEFPRSSSLSPRERPERLSDAERQTLRSLLDGRDRGLRDDVRTLLMDPSFRFVSELNTSDYREQVLAWLKLIAGRGLLAKCYPHGLESARDLGRFVAVFEMLALFDLSLVVKFGVQAGLFAGAIESLGTAEHHKLLPAALRAELLGCFAMTERAHGSNVRSLKTTARYLPEKQKFVIETPDLGAGKEWIGNAAKHASWAVVFAQLETLGEQYGVHALLVQIRNERGDALPGVRIEDCGEKMGLNGVDNGRLWFDGVEVAREALLDRFGQVTIEGEYQSPIPSSSRRFFTMLGTLVGGRISVAGAATSASKVGLAIAVRYAEHRTQFEGPDGREKSLLTYLTHRRRLLPRLAAAYAFSFAQQELVKRASEQGAGGHAATDADDVDTLAAGLKALSTWQAIDTLQQCRECCGGQGYLTSNRIDALRTDSDVFTTFEGDNTVLLQLVANNLLRQLRGAMKKRPVRTIVRSLIEDVAIAVGERNPIAVRNDDSASLRSPELHATALRFREKALLVSLARRVSRRIEGGMDRQEAFDSCQDHALALGRAHIESFVLGCFQQVAQQHPALAPLCALYGLWRIEADLAWFLENDFLAPAKSRGIRKTVNELIAELTPHALDLVDAFAIPPPCLGPLGDPAFMEATGLSRAP
jgi:acyl-CoA oxidase